MTLTLPAAPGPLDSAGQGDDFLRALVTALDSALAPVNLQGAFADRPQSPVPAVGTRYWCTDLGWELRSSGSGWELVNGVAIGDLVETLRTSDPPGGYYLLADGRSIPRASYPLLSAVVGGNSTNIVIPDLRGAVTVAPSNMGTRGNRAGNDAVQISATDGRTGVARHTLSAAEMPSHAHGVTDGQHYHPLGSADSGGGVLEQNANGEALAVSGQGATKGLLWGTGSFFISLFAKSRLAGISLQSTGGGGDHLNVQPSVPVNKLIRVR